MGEIELIKLLEKVEINREEQIANNNNVKIENTVYLGTITWKEIDSIGLEVSIDKDIIMLIENNNGTIQYKFYDENTNLLAVDLGDGNPIVSSEFADKENLDFLEDIKNLNKEGVSLEEIRGKVVTEYAEVLGVSPEDIVDITVTELSQKIEDKLPQNNEQKLNIEEKSQNNDNIKETNKNVLEGISAKTETNLSEKVTDSETLGSLLGISSDSKLITVYSKDVQDNRNSTEFTFLLQKSDGTLEKLDMLKEFGGSTPTQNILASNRDGSELEMQGVNSLYRIRSTANTNDMLAVKRGKMGIIELSYVHIDKDDGNRGLSIPIATNQIHSTTKDVRHELSLNRGDDNATEQLQEYDKHKDAGCEPITVQEINSKEDEDCKVAENQKHDHMRDDEREFGPKHLYY